ncbi:serine/threonine-protein kinase [Aquisphaera insulae]|uniref:serine/threonine-protein kinase n=1 Tax=Aquisphaera insulae TaxID=2712864 RepID=UPI0013EAF5BF|nr:serine/threonine-protein kinase [Aquisphaera insulae]
MPSAEIQLIFGLLALQNGLIDREQLVAAFRARRLDKSRSLADQMVGSGIMDADDRRAVEALAERMLRRHGGDSTRSLGAMSAGASTRESLLAIGDPDLEATLGHVPSGPATEASRPGPHAVYSVGSATGDGQRFRVLRPHARGGLGAVFVAIDSELNREVALKQILDHHADDPTSRQRFLIEAEITGGLEHPGIVPVYGLGTYGGGRPYYAMRFIKGDSLKEAIGAFHADEANRSDPGRRSLELRELLRRFVDVCNAIDYAHGRGVLHRDLKPGNVIVGKHGETLVIDWGLAKPMGRPDVEPGSGERPVLPSSASGSAETLPGSVIGTPAYMSPEQAAGDIDRLGPRSDVYSLGATLYCLLTGKAPFEGPDPLAVIRDVQLGSFPPPARVSPAVEKALEAVCLKAMATRPEDRYPTARALANDVERWAADEPVSAWTEPAVARLRRWLRRNRAAAIGGAAAVLMAIAGLLGMLAVQSRANVRLEAKNVELLSANEREASANAGLREANERVQARFELARSAIRSFQAAVTEDEMLKGKELVGLRNKLLRSAAGFYERLESLLRGQADRPSRAVLAQSYAELGDLTDKIGDKPEALAVHRKALAIRRELADGADADIALDLVRSLIATGSLAGTTGERTFELAAFDEARRLASALAFAPTAPAPAREVLASTLIASGRAFRARGELTNALEVCLEALALRRRLAAESPESAEPLDHVASTLKDIAVIRSELGRTPEAIATHREALDIRRKLAAARPDSVERLGQLATSEYLIGHVLIEAGQVEAALASYRDALEHRAKLATANPAVTAFRVDVAGVHDAIGLLHGRAGRSDDAMASHRQALAIRRKLAADHPAVDDFRDWVADSLSNLGLVQSQVGRQQEALDSYLEALTIRRKLAANHPEIAEYTKDLSANLTNLGILQESMVRSDDAIASHRESVALNRKLFASHPEVVLYADHLSLSLLNLAPLLSLTGHIEQGLTAIREATSILRGLVERNPMRSEFRNHLAASLLISGDILKASARPLGAAPAYREAIAIYRELAREGKASAEAFYVLASTLNNLSIVLAGIGQIPEARSLQVEALALWRKLTSQDPSFVEYQKELASCLNAAGMDALAEGSSAEATRRFAEELAICEKLAGESSPASAAANANRLARCLVDSATADLRLGKSADARRSCERVLEILEPFLRDGSKDAMPRLLKGVSLLRLGQVHSAEGDTASASAEWKKAVEILSPDANTEDLAAYHLACCRALMSTTTRVDSAREGEAAVALLRRAAELGIRNLGQYLNEPALDSLRDREDFQSLMRDVSFPIMPFAPSAP